MKKTVLVGDKEVTVTIERLPLQPGAPYSQGITAEHGGHKLQHTVTHDPGKFVKEDVAKHIEEVSQRLAARVASMSDVKDFLDEFHSETPFIKS